MRRPAWIVLSLLLVVGCGGKVPTSATNGQPRTYTKDDVQIWHDLWTVQEQQNALKK